MLLGWLLVALAAVYAVALMSYSSHRKKWIARLKPGTMYRPVNGLQIALYVGILVAWSFGSTRLGDAARWPVLAVGVVAIVVGVWQHRKPRTRRATRPE